MRFVISELYIPWIIIFPTAMWSLVIDPLQQKTKQFTCLFYKHVDVFISNLIISFITSLRKLGRSAPITGVCVFVCYWKE